MTEHAPNEPATAPEGHPAEGRRGVLVVGIGASAGGLEAVRRVLAGMRGDCGLAFVVIPHLAPTHTSLMAELLAPHTALRVSQVTGRTVVEANHAYVVPPGHHLVIKDEVLHLAEPETRGRVPVPVDLFFRSLAEDLRDRAIGVILSGTGTDGALGVRAIKERGGTVFVQDPTSAAFDGMPGAAVRTGLADYVLPLEEVPGALAQYADHLFAVRDGATAQPRVAVLDAILSVLQVRTLQSFRAYKRATLTRRILRRMGIHHITDMGQYLDLLRGDPAEQSRLARDFLISVTCFFRDPEAFAALDEVVIGPIVRGRAPDRPLRVWVPGCATGEEAYSIGMLLIEACGAVGQEPNVQIFASDLDEAALDVARAGIYPINIEADVSAERLLRFFTREDTSYQVSRQLREIVTFANQNLISDPPFARMDLISCRNMLIYFEPEAQRKVITLFHFALREGAHLFLGNSETVGRCTDLFTPMSKQFHIFRRVGASRPTFEFPAGRVLDPRLPSTAMARSLSPRDVRPFELVQRSLIEEFAPAAVLINRNDEILYLSGPVDRYLKVPAGEPQLNLLTMVRDGLRGGVRGHINTAFSRDERVVARGVSLVRDQECLAVTVTARPVGGAGDLLLITFEDEIPPSASAADAIPAATDQAVIQQLEQELLTIREDLQSSIEELEATNEEYRASIEEAISVNEELQSTNEELETSKEEIQSVNEELQTLNNELKSKVRELEAANNDLDNLLTSTDIATIFLDPRFRIKRFTPATGSLVSLITSDIGRPIQDFAFRHGDEALLEDARAVAATLVPAERRITTPDGGCLIRRVLPYRTSDSGIDGVVITFTDVTAYKRAEDALRGKATELRQVMDAVPAAVWIADDRECRQVTGNRALTDLLRLPEGAPPALDGRLRVLKDGAELPQADHPLRRAALLGEEVRDCEIELVFHDGAVRALLGNAVPRWDEDGRSQGAVAAFIDITGRKRTEQALLQAKTVAEQVNQAMTRFMAAASHDLRQPLQSASLFLGVIEARCAPALAPTVGRLRESMDALEELLNGLLDLSAVDPASDVPDESDFSVAEVLTTLAAEYQGVAEAKELDLRLVPCGVLIHSDHRLLPRLVRNLVDNAVKYTESGRILLGCRRRPEGLAIQVWDTGIGIPEDQLTAIFEEFYQVDNSARDRRLGLGLGLAIVERVSRTLGHPVRVRSAVGKGSMFEVLVPYARTRADEPAAPARQAAPAETAPDQSLIILVDDDRDVLAGLRMMIGAWGYPVAAGATAEAAWREVCQTAVTPRLILADHRLGKGATGIDAISWLRDRIGVSVPGVLITGDASTAQLDDVRAGRIGRLLKPVSPDKLRRLIRGYLEGPSAEP